MRAERARFERAMRPLSSRAASVRRALVREWVLKHSVDFELPVNVRTCRDAGEPDRGDELSARNGLSGGHVHSARVVVAGLEAARVLDADAQSAHWDRSRRDDDA